MYRVWKYNIRRSLATTEKKPPKIMCSLLDLILNFPHQQWLQAGLMHPSKRGKKFVIIYFLVDFARSLGQSAPIKKSMKNSFFFHMQSGLIL